MNKEHSNDGKNAGACNEQWKSPRGNKYSDPDKVQEPGRKGIHRRALGGFEDDFTKGAGGHLEMMRLHGALQRKNTSNHRPQTPVCES
jgi:hypothetical protein